MDHRETDTEDIEAEAEDEATIATMKTFWNTWVPNHAGGMSPLSASQMLSVQTLVVTDFSPEGIADFFRECNNSILVHFVTEPDSQGSRIVRALPYYDMAAAAAIEPGGVKIHFPPNFVTSPLPPNNRYFNRDGPVIVSINDTLDSSATHQVECLDHHLDHTIEPLMVALNINSVFFPEYVGDTQTSRRRWIMLEFVIRLWAGYILIPSTDYHVLLLTDPNIRFDIAAVLTDFSIQPSLNWLEENNTKKKKRKGRKRNLT